MNTKTSIGYPPFFPKENKVSPLCKPVYRRHLTSEIEQMLDSANSRFSEDEVVFSSFTTTLTLAQGWSSSHADLLCFLRDYSTSVGRNLAQRAFSAQQLAFEVF